MDIIVYNILTALCCFVIGYLFGSFPSGVVIGKITQKKDPREYGSNNSGGTNVSRLWGFKVGWMVYALDFAKAAIPIWALWAITTFVNFGDKPLIPPSELLLSGETAGYIVQWPAYWLVVLGVTIGHCYPVFANFKGGKAAAVTCSSAFFSSWFTGSVAMITFFASLKARKYVSLASIVAACGIAISSWLTCIPVFNKYCMWSMTLCPGYVFATVMTLSSLILILRHHKNIHRLANDGETKISWMK